MPQPEAMIAATSTAIDRRWLMACLAAVGAVLVGAIMALGG